MKKKLQFITRKRTNFKIWQYTQPNEKKNASFSTLEKSSLWGNLEPNNT